MIHNWVWWGLGWFFMPRMTIGILLCVLFPIHYNLGLTLAIIGALIDLGSGWSSTN
jgi:hypothetical protein